MKKLNKKSVCLLRESGLCVNGEGEPLQRLAALALHLSVELQVGFLGGRDGGIQVFKNS